MNKIIEQDLLDALSQVHQDVPRLKEHLRWEEHLQMFHFFGRTISVKHKSIISPQDVPDLKSECTQDEVVFGNYITPGAKELLKEAGISYLDKMGNTFLDFPGGVLVYIEARKSRPEHIKIKGASFNKAGLKLVYLLLKNDAYANMPYRMIAKEAKIAVGSVSKVMHDLHDKGYIQKKNEESWIVRNHKDLLKEWTRAYNETVRPDLQIGIYRSIDKDFYPSWQSYALPDQSAWGGEPAAFKMIEYMKPAHFVVYTSNPKEVMRKFKLVPDPGGNFELLKTFTDPILLGMDKVDPVLVYADLVNTEDERAIETAQKIYEQCIQSRYQ